MSSADKSPTGVRRNGATPAQQSLALELPLAANDPLANSAAAGRSWLCIHLPALSLEALGTAHDSAVRAVFEDQDGIRKVLLADAAACAAGIRPGLSVNAALALLPSLVLEQRDTQCEQRTLLRLAGWAEQFTSFVVVEPPSTLLLELAGSLQLFGGLRVLRTKIARGLREQGFTAARAIAPTPLAATWLARAGHRVCIRAPANLVGALSRLPLTCLDWPPSLCETLNSMGISLLGDCLRLPRSGFAKRFGAKRLLQFDRALGRLPDPRENYRSPERFCEECELNEELSDSELIQHACEQLLKKLEQFLLTRQLAVQRIGFSFFHLQQAATHLSLGCVQADRAVEHWSGLLRIRLERLVLAAPVIAIRLRAGQGQAMVARTGSLHFNKQQQSRRQQSIHYLVERLGARLGADLVHGVTTAAEHRPQYAWRCRPVSVDVPQCQATPAIGSTHQASASLADLRKTNSLLLRRPTWILQQPQPLVTRGGQPVYQGVLQLTDGPERLESGWWDDDGIARDYFIAVNPQGACLWVYRNRSGDHGWYLHGMFG